MNQRGNKEEINMQTCSKCGEARIERESVVTGVGGGASFFGDYTGVLYHSPNHMQNKVTHIYASTCLSCGHIELYLDPKQLK
jgi:predicted nucleic-acid-binding Zn-ribbon protein